MALIVKKWGYGYAVFDGSERVSAEVSQRAYAEAWLDRMEAERRAAKMRRHRPCLRCGEVMLSQGPHHRMCELCRREAGSLPTQMAG